MFVAVVLLSSVWSVMMAPPLVVQQMRVVQQRIR